MDLTIKIQSLKGFILQKSNFGMRTNYFKNIWIVCLLWCLPLFPSCKKTGENPQAQTPHVHGIIPLPLNVDLFEGNLSIDKNIVLVTNPQFQSAVDVIENALNQALDQAVI